MADKLTYAERLDLERNRDGKEPLTASERFDRLVKIRDGSIVWAELCVAQASAKGSASATDMYAFARDEIQRIEDDASAGASARIPWAYTDWDGDTPEASDTVN